MEADDAQAEEEIEQIHLTLSHLSALASLLTAIKIGSKQVSQGGVHCHSSAHAQLATAAEGEGLGCCC